MKTTLGIAAMLLLALTGYDQVKSADRKMLTVTEPVITQFKVKEQKAWDAGNKSLALAYSDSVRYSIIGAYIDNHTFRTLDNRDVKLESLDKPLLLINSATWCAGCVSEVPVLNKVAKEFADKVTFVVLFHDNKDEKLFELAKKCNDQILLVPSIKQEESAHILNISGFRHILGYSANYVINTKERL